MAILSSDKTIRLIELFGGIGSQAQALKNIGANFEHYRLVEFDKYPVATLSTERISKLRISAKPMLRISESWTRTPISIC